MTFQKSLRPARALNHKYQSKELSIMRIMIKLGLFTRRDFQPFRESVRSPVDVCAVDRSVAALVEYRRVRCTRTELLAANHAILRWSNPATKAPGDSQTGKRACGRATPAPLRRKRIGPSHGMAASTIAGATALITKRLENLRTQQYHHRLGQRFRHFCAWLTD
jgi:hypothetical protein